MMDGWAMVDGVVIWDDGRMKDDATILYGDSGRTFLLCGMVEWEQL